MTTFKEINKQKFLFSLFKDFIFNLILKNVSVKYISCRMNGFSKKCKRLTDKMIHRGATLL